MRLVLKTRKLPGSKARFFCVPTDRGVTIKKVEDVGKQFKEIKRFQKACKCKKC